MSTLPLLVINTGSSANSGDGDSLRTAFNKINSNFQILTTATEYTLTTATTSTLGGVIIGIGLAISGDGTLSATGAITSSTLSIIDQTQAPSIDIVSYSGSTSLSSGGVTMFSFDKTVYRSATIDISANNVSMNTDDIASGYIVTRNTNASQILGSGVVAIDVNGNTSNAEWDLTTSNYGNNVNIQLYSPAGITGHLINWRAKVSLFRL